MLESKERSASFVHYHSLRCFSTNSAIQHLPDIPSESPASELSNDISNISRIAEAVEPLSVEKHTLNEKTEFSTVNNATNLAIHDYPNRSLKRSASYLSNGAFGTS